MDGEAQLIDGSMQYAHCLRPHLKSNFFNIIFVFKIENFPIFFFFSILLTFFFLLVFLDLCRLPLGIASVHREASFSLVA